MHDEERRFLDQALQRGWITAVQAGEAERAQQGMAGLGLDAPIWEALILKGALTREQADQIRGAKAFVFGPYTIEAKVGEGGMGVVYRARKGSDPERVALKLLPDRFSKDAEYVKRFEREARIAVKLAHPNIVKGIDFGSVGGRWYYAMEYIRGDTVEQLISQQRYLDSKAAVRISIQVALALDEICRAGLVHRDVKPDNIIIGPDGVAKLMDLGLAKSVGGGGRPSITQSGLALGTPHYMAPEQISGEVAVDIRSDIYSLGATLYHMLTGAAPFHGVTPLEIVNRQLRHEVQDPRELRPDLPEGICQVVEKMMAREPGDRYEAPVVLVADLYRVLEGQPPHTEQLALGRSVVGRRRAKVTARRKPAEPGERLSRRQPATRKAPKAWIAAAITGGVSLSIVMVALIAGAGSSPPPPPPPPPADDSKPPVGSGGPKGAGGGHSAPGDVSMDPKSFLVEADLGAMGLSPISEDGLWKRGIDHERYGKAHVFKMGEVEELEVQVVPCRDDAEAGALLDEELGGEQGKREAALHKKAATFYEVSGAHVVGRRSWVSMLLRADGAGVVKVAFQDRHYFVKAIWAEGVSRREGLDEVRVKAIRAASHVKTKLK